MLGSTVSVNAIKTSRCRPLAGLFRAATRRAKSDIAPACSTPRRVKCDIAPYPQQQQQQQQQQQKQQQQQQQQQQPYKALACLISGRKLDPPNLGQASQTLKFGYHGC